MDGRRRRARSIRTPMDHRRRASSASPRAPTAIWRPEIFLSNARSYRRTTCLRRQPTVDHANGFANRRSDKVGAVYAERRSRRLSVSGSDAQFGRRDVHTLVACRYDHRQLIARLNEVLACASADGMARRPPAQTIGRTRGRTAGAFNASAPWPAFAPPRPPH